MNSEATAAASDATNALSSLPFMQFGVPLDATSLLFFGCLAAAIGLVYLFCRQKFAERLIIENEDYVYQLLPRQLATREEYSRGFLIYFQTMVFTVVLLSLIGPKNLASLGIPLPTEVSYVVVPLFVAFLLVGVMPNVPMLQEIERRLRQYAHERAFIPTAARATAQRLSAADFDFSSYAGEALRAPEMHGVDAADFSRSRRTLEHDWARLSCLVYELKSRRMSGLLDSLDSDLLETCDKDLENIEAKRQAMEAEVGRYRAETAQNPAYTNDALRHAIRSNLYKLYILLGCAVRLKKQPHDDIDLALRPFGFKLSQIAPPASNKDLKLVAMTFIAFAVVFIDFAAVELAHLRVWRVSEVFPLTWYQPLIDASYAVLIYGVAMRVADAVRTRLIKRGSWYQAMGPRRVAVTANYIRAGIVSGIVGYVGLLAWSIAFADFDVTDLGLNAPFALLPAVTGAIYAWQLDNVELQRRPSRLIEIGSQAALTAILGFVASVAWTGMMLGDASMAIDHILLKTLIAATAGALLGWYVPMAAAASQYDPLAEARDERIRTLEAAALKRFGSPTATTAWLDAPHPVLAGKSPRAAAAADVEGFEHAVCLLQAPQSLAA